LTRPFPDRLDRIAADVEELKRRQQTARIQQMTADMASEIERIKGEDWKEPEDLVDFAKQGEFKGSDQ
jgi:cell division septum initiation protein DivIVA